VVDGPPPRFPFFAISPLTELARVFLLNTFLKGILISNQTRFMSFSPNWPLSSRKRRFKFSVQVLPPLWVSNPKIPGIVLIALERNYISSFMSFSVS